MPLLAKRRGGAIYRLRGSLLLIALGAWSGAVIGCAELNPKTANRCDESSDCAGGRVCEKHVCVAFEKTPVEMNADPNEPQKPPRSDGRHADGTSGGSSGPDAGNDAGGTDGSGGSGDGGRGGQNHPPPSTLDDAGSDDGGKTEPRVETCDDSFIAQYPLALWLDGAHGVEVDRVGRVESWTDRTLHAHKALPTGPAETWPLRVVKTKHTPPGVQFGAIDDQNVRRMLIADAPSLWFERNDFAYLVVLRYRNTYEAESTSNEIGLVLSKNCGSCLGYPGFALFANDNYGRDASLGDGTVHSSFNAQVAFGPGYYSRAATQKQGFNDGKIHVVAVQRVGAMLSINVDGQLQHEEFVYEVDVSAVEDAMALGANAGGAVQALDGAIFEVMALRGDSVRDLDPLIGCLLVKYGVAVSMAN